MKISLSQISGAIEGQNQELPETTEITIPKLQFGVSKKWIFHYDYSLEAAVNLNVRFIENNDIISHLLPVWILLLDLNLVISDLWCI